MDAVAATVVEIVKGGTVEVLYTPLDEAPQLHGADGSVWSAADSGPPGWRTTFIVTLRPLVGEPDSHHGLLEHLAAALPRAAQRSATRFRHSVGIDVQEVRPTVLRAIRDSVASEVLSEVLQMRTGQPTHEDLIDRTLDFLIELSGSRVESHDLTHGVLITNVLRDDPRLRFAYPEDVRTAKRAPLLFDGERSLLVVDYAGRARTELELHRMDRLGSAGSDVEDVVGEVEGGSFVAEATRRLGGMGFFLREDRTIWAFVDGMPLLMRRAEHWTAFPLQLTTSVSRMIGGGAAAEIVVRSAFIISGQRHGAILAIVSDEAALEGVVAMKDRYDLRNEIDPEAMRPETRLHHLIDAQDLDEHTLARLAALDGATVLDRDARLLAYGAVVTTSDSQHEGARTAAARALSERADIVLKVSSDGDITIFREGAAVTTLLGGPSIEA